MKNLKNSFNILPNKNTDDKEFGKLLCTLEERHEFDSLSPPCSDYFKIFEICWQQQPSGGAPINICLSRAGGCTIHW
ncbi:hypothetical protein AGMMS49593_02150 [Endomicrobiia bacterium]|nr:hypothetical protein AGMMS49593_02150 [Endomicrobiia bacterium]